MKLHFSNTIEAGTDEAGRGCIAGPVTAAAVILPDLFENNLLNDSKKLTPSVRNSLRQTIENDSICYAVGHVYEKEIDEINILNASIKAMHHALNQLTVSPNFIIVDGNRFKKFKDIEHECIVKGDAKFMSIAAASILAKTYRDEHMRHLHKEYPMYNWAKNKGYPTKEHREAIRKYGPSPYHRKSFRLLPEQLQFKF